MVPGTESGFPLTQVLRPSLCPLHSLHRNHITYFLCRVTTPKQSSRDTSSDIGPTIRDSCVYGRSGASRTTQLAKLGHGRGEVWLHNVVPGMGMELAHVHLEQSISPTIFGLGPHPSVLWDHASPSNSYHFNTTLEATKQ